MFILTLTLFLCPFHASYSTIIDLINSDKKSSWKAGHNHLTSQNISTIRRSLDQDMIPLLSHPRNHSLIPARSSSTPFDSRERWPNLIHSPKDQGSCNTAWAFGATLSLSDRMSIKGCTDELLSPQDIISCEEHNVGCKGASPLNAWTYLMKNGATMESCIPYASENGTVPFCQKKCIDGKKQKRVFPQSFSRLTADRAEIDVKQYGPLEIWFLVYEDLVTYKEGIYEHKTGEMLGAQAGRLIGWGSKGRKQYWIVANNWGEEWGEQGYFKILRGHDHCGIESVLISGKPKC
ncbi:putative Cathepsin B [Blattamonas nauphoetae]|uniref:Cathepsin B n=1 Tax=Blattamonas nauphoetae TaxID=2049346 RepID=A0ABQ9XGR0_9EUKA|nr:putative Cathepsin B [Blattamonas nauphoetae]